MYELVHFNYLLHRVPWNERQGVILKLNQCSKHNSDKSVSLIDSLAYKKQSLMYDIYRLIKREPLTAPLFTSLETVQDVQNRQFSEEIMQGINAYIEAPFKKQRAFQRDLLNPYTPINMAARAMCRFRKTR